jgi:hypothetical protein
MSKKDIFHFVSFVSDIELCNKHLQICRRYPDVHLTPKKILPLFWGDGKNIVSLLLKIVCWCEMYIILILHYLLYFVQVTPLFPLAKAHVYYSGLVHQINYKK